MYEVLANGHEFSFTTHLVNKGVVVLMNEGSMDYVPLVNSTIYKEVQRYQKFSKFFELIKDMKINLDFTHLRYTLLVVDNE